MIESTQVGCLADLVRLVIEESLEHDSPELWWRGQEDSCWGLQPSIFRNPRPPLGEDMLLRRFIHGAGSRYRDCPADEDTVGWMFLAQHYSLPTRLLDWTQSMMVALHFAVANETTSDAALFMFDPWKMNRHVGRRKGVASSASKVAEEMAGHAMGEGAKGLPLVVPVIPRERDIRHLVQLARFTMHKDGRMLDEIDGASEFLKKYVVPRIHKDEFRRDLQTMGIRTECLFPDLEHLAMSLKDPSCPYVRPLRF